MGLVNDGELFTVLAAQVLSPLTISPRVSLCSSVLSSARKMFSHNTWVGVPLCCWWCSKTASIPFCHTSVAAFGKGVHNV